MGLIQPAAQRDKKKAKIYHIICLTINFINQSCLT